MTEIQNLHAGIKKRMARLEAVQQDLESLRDAQAKKESRQIEESSYKLGKALFEEAHKLTIEIHDIFQVLHYASDKAVDNPTATREGGGGPVWPK